MKNARCEQQPDGKMLEKRLTKRTGWKGSNTVVHNARRTQKLRSVSMDFVAPAVVDFAISAHGTRRLDDEPASRTSYMNPTNMLRTLYLEASIVASL